MRRTPTATWPPSTVSPTTIGRDMSTPTPFASPAQTATILTPPITGMAGVLVSTPARAVAAGALATAT
eukprot:7606044-Lingulodinium_polyedra.AAC.1